MECLTVRRLAARYLGNRLALRTRRRLEEHVGACLPCARFVRARRKLRDAVDCEMPRTAPIPGTLRDSIRVCMNCMDDPGRTVCPRLRRRLLRLVPAALPGVQ